MINISFFGRMATMLQRHKKSNDIFKISMNCSNQSLISSLSKPLSISNEDVALFEKWQRKILMSDFNKEFFEDLAESPSNFFLLDFLNERLDLLSYKDTYVTYSHWTKSSKFNYFAGKSIEILPRIDFYQQNKVFTEDAISDFAKKLLEIYEGKQIILIKCYLSEKYVDDSGKIMPFPKITFIKETNEMLSEMYSVAERCLPDVNIIETPKNITSYEDQIYKPSSSLYNHEFVDIIYQKITGIALNRFLQRNQQSNCFAKIESINRGDKGKKYLVKTEDGEKFFLRILPKASYHKEKEIFEVMQKLKALNIPTMDPLEIGECTDGSTYSIYSWINGIAFDKVLHTLDVTEQRRLGLKAGEILRKIHSIPSPSQEEDWKLEYTAHIDSILKRYAQSKLSLKGDDSLISYIHDNMHLLDIKRPRSFIHYDYSIYNMMLDDGELKIVDFGNGCYGDPWEDFKYIYIYAAENFDFAKGFLDGYFNGDPPTEFWPLVSLYISFGSLNNARWHASKKRHETSRKRIENADRWLKYASIFRNI